MPESPRGRELRRQDYHSAGEAPADQVRNNKAIANGELDFRAGDRPAEERHQTKREQEVVDEAGTDRD